MDDRLVQIQKLLDAADGNLSSARTMIREMTQDNTAPLDLDKKLEGLTTSDEGKVIEGVFDGEMMVSSDGQTYPVPPNYASKSKLMEGDTLKLTISEDGSFLFKQISPVERRNAIGTLAQADGSYTISAEGKSYKVLTASVTFYRAEPGDQVTILLPKEHDAAWAVLENVIKKSEMQSTPPTGPNLLLTEVDEEPAVVAERVIPEPEEVLNTPVEPVAAEPETPSIEDILSASATTPTVEPPVSETIVEPAVEVSLDVPETVVDTPAVVEPEPLTTAPETNPNSPDIEFPAGNSTLSDDQLLENLKNNLKNLEQPAYTAPENVAARPVDNIVASDLAQMDNKQPTINNQPQASDKPIAELDI